MTQPAAEASEPAALRDRLRAHRMLADAPDTELDWLLEHGTLVRYAVGDHAVPAGQPVPGMYIMLAGRLTHYRGRGAARRKVMDWSEGDVTGVLPYSRLGKAGGVTVVDETAEALLVPRDDVAHMPVTCPHLTAALVHVMVDRARTFTSSDQQLEKLASLGKLAAGMAHELNNPAAAAARSAQLLSQALTDADEASRALGQANLAESEQAAVDAVRAACLANPATGVLSPLERADREAAMADWLADHAADASSAVPLADTDLSLDTLRALADTLPPDKLGAAIRWMAAACTVRQLAREIEQATARVSELVSAVKSFTYMDRGAAAEPVDLAKGLTDTIAMLSAKARGKEVAVTLDVPAGLPRVNAFGAQLNQVWTNLIDNALDAVDGGGRVAVSAVQEGDAVVVRIIDDGPGIPPEIEDRMFDPFFTTKPVGSGTGLGLDIARRLVGQHDGMIAVTTEPGRTEFRVTLPLGGDRANDRGARTG